MISHIQSISSIDRIRRRWKQNSADNVVNFLSIKSEKNASNILMHGAWRGIYVFNSRDVMEYEVFVSVTFSWSCAGPEESLELGCKFSAGVVAFPVDENCNSMTSNDITMLCSASMYSRRSRGVGSFASQTASRINPSSWCHRDARILWVSIFRPFTSIFPSTWRPIEKRTRISNHDGLGPGGLPTPCAASRRSLKT